MAAGPRGARWKVIERVVDTSRRARISIAEVELPDGVRFEQWVTRAQPAAVVAVVNERDEVLMMRRHRFIIDSDVWELPGGYIDEEEEDPATTAAREVEEETGWRPGPLQHLLTFQPSVGSADQAQHLYVARSAQPTGQPVDINEADELRWIRLTDAHSMIKAGEIVGSASIIGVLELLTAKSRAQHWLAPNAPSQDR